MWEPVVCPNIPCLPLPIFIWIQVNITSLILIILLVSQENLGLGLIVQKLLKLSDRTVILNQATHTDPPWKNSNQISFKVHILFQTSKSFIPSPPCFFFFLPSFLLFSFSFLLHHQIFRFRLDNKELEKRINETMKTRNNKMNKQYTKKKCLLNAISVFVFILYDFLCNFIYPKIFSLARLCVLKFVSSYIAFSFLAFGALLLSLDVNCRFFKKIV